MARDSAGQRGTRNGRDNVVIKKYANRRLYNTATSSYVTLEHLRQMISDGIDFVVYDAKSGDDITRSVLTQIILEEESKGENLLPISFLRQLISFYGDSMQAVVPNYLEQMMGAFVANQERLREQMQETMSGMFPFSGNLQEIGRQNAALMENAMRMFSPFAGSGESQSGTTGGATGKGNATGQRAAQGGNEDDRSIDDLQEQINALQDKIDRLSRDQGGGSSGGASDT